MDRPIERRIAWYNFLFVVCVQCMFTYDQSFLILNLEVCVPSPMENTKFNLQINNCTVGFCKSLEVIHPATPLSSFQNSFEMFQHVFTLFALSIISPV